MLCIAVFLLFKYSIAMASFYSVFYLISFSIFLQADCIADASNTSNMSHINTEGNLGLCLLRNYG